MILECKSGGLLPGTLSISARGGGGDGPFHHDLSRASRHLPAQCLVGVFLETDERLHKGSNENLAPVGV